MRYVSFCLLAAALLLFSLSCDSEQVQAPSVFTLSSALSATLVPNADLSPQEWDVQPSMPNNYEAIDDISPDGNNIYTGYDLASRFGFSDVTGHSSVQVTDIGLILHADFDLHQDDAVYVRVTVYADGSQIGSNEFRWCTADPPVGCSYPGAPDGSTTWTYDVTNLSLGLSAINSLEVEVSAFFIYDHEPWLNHVVHIDNINADITFYDTSGHNKGPRPHQE